MHALITGGSRGIGFAIAKSLAAKGWKCTIVGRNAKTLELQVKELGAEHDFQAFDVADRKAWLKCAEGITSIDALINAAGITHKSLSLHTDGNVVDEVLGTNLHGTIHGCSTMAKHLIKSKGSIVNISSVVGIKGLAGSSVYAASKAGVLGYTRSLALELAPKVQVNAICPGYIETNMTSALNASKLSIPMQRMGTADEIASSVYFLLQNSYITGTEVIVDGGLTA